MRGAWSVALGVAMACSPQRGTIGAVLSRSPTGRIVIQEAPADLAAARAGLAPGDELLLVDGRDARAMDDPELRRALQGEPGTVVHLTAQRGEAVVRASVRLTPARHRRKIP